MRDVLLYQFGKCCFVLKSFELDFERNERWILLILKRWHIDPMPIEEVFGVPFFAFGFL